MELLTERMRILNVAKEWKRGYRADNEIYLKLKKLNLKTATAEDVEKITGNPLWIELFCDGCGERVKAVVQLGEELNWERDTTYICEECLKKALELINWN